MQSLAADLLVPAIGLAIPGLRDLKNLITAVGSQTFGIGNLVALITFTIAAFAIFLIVKMCKKWGVDSIHPDFLSCNA